MTIPFSRRAARGTVRAILSLMFGLGCSDNAKPTQPASSLAAPVPAIPLPADCLGNATIEDTSTLSVTGRWRDRTVKVFVDTGANAGSVSTELAADYALPVAGNGKYASASGTFVDTKLHDVGEITVGGVTIDGTAFSTHDPSVERYDFAIGLDQLRQHVMVLDLNRAAFCLLDSPHPAADRPLRLKGSGPAQRMIVTVGFGTVQLDEMLLDTGAGVSTVNDGHLAQLAHNKLPLTVTAVDATGAEREVSLVMVPSVCVGVACSTNQLVMPMADVSDLLGYHVDGILGLPFLSSHTLIVDFPAGTLGLR